MLPRYLAVRFKSDIYFIILSSLIDADGPPRKGMGFSAHVAKGGTSKGRPGYSRLERGIPTANERTDQGKRDKENV
jgi:hypothetical protein